jgi:hypothetical protein
MKSLVLAVLLLIACESREEREAREGIESLQRTIQEKGPPPIPSAIDTSAPTPTATTAQIQRPCTGKRPYRDWSNAEVSTALVRHMGTNHPALPDLIEEAGCRQP